MWGPLVLRLKVHIVRYATGLIHQSFCDESKTKTKYNKKNAFVPIVAEMDTG